MKYIYLVKLIFNILKIWKTFMRIKYYEIYTFEQWTVNGEWGNDLIIQVSDISHTAPH